MTRGRKPTDAPEIIEPDLDQGRIDTAVAVMRDTALGAIARSVEAEQNVRAVALQVGYQLPGDFIDPDLIQRDIAANMRRSVEACLEVGRGLSVLKAACEHGQFLARLDVLGIEARVAQRFMATARRFSKTASTPLLSAAGNQTKLFELLILEDGQVEELELTGQTGELSLDDIASMSVKELRAALRKTREELEDVSGRSAEKTQQIEALHTEKQRIKRMPPDDVLAELHKETTAIANDARGAIIGQLRQAVAATQMHHEINGGDSRVFLGGLVGQLFADLVSLRAEFDLPEVSTDDHGWINQE